MSSPALMLGANSSGMRAFRQISSTGRSMIFDTTWTMHRAAWPSRLIVSSTRPAPAKGRLSRATRSALDTAWASPSVACLDRTSSTVRSSNRRSMWCSIMRSRNTCSAPCENDGVTAPRQPRTICLRRSTMASSTASASDAPTYPWSRVTMQFNMIGALARHAPRGLADRGADRVPGQLGRELLLAGHERVERVDGERIRECLRGVIAAVEQPVQ